MKDMCARLLMCPLCSQPGFLTLDALRAGLISVATRPLICPVCNEVLLGIDKLTIHLFSHTINMNSSNINNNTAEMSKQLNITTSNNTLVSIHSIQDACFQDWNVSKPHSTGVVKILGDANSNFQNNPDSTIKSVTMKDKIVSNPEVPAQHQNLPLKDVPRIVFASNQSCESGKTNAFHEHCVKKGVPPETLKVNSAMQYYSNENNKHVNVPENHSCSEQQSIQTLKEWIQEQHCEQETLTKNVTSMSPNKSSRTTRELNQIESIKSGNSTQNFDKFPNFESFSKISETNLETHKNEKNDKENTVNRSDKSKDGRYEQVSPHLKMLKDQTEKTERCDICGFHFPDYNILLLHKQLVHMIEEKDLNVIPENYFKNYSCHLCSKVFKMRGSLMVHMRVAHVGHNSVGSLHKDGQVEVIFNENGYNCPTCGKKFKKEQHVIQHLKTHEAKQWECDVCSKMFTTKYFLKKHKRLHSGEMPYKCNICNKTFTFQQSYHKHRLYHKDDKPHTCATCGRSFKELSTLHNHERIHTGEKPFACETCGKCFRQRVSYLVHRRIHTGVMPYKCAICGKSFRYKVSQRTHKCPAQQSGSTQQTNDSEQKKIQLPEIQTTNSKHCEVQETNSLQENQPILQMVENEENKYILIINNQGQHLLTREANAGNIQEPVNKLQSSKNMNTDRENKESKNQWVSNIPTNLIFRKSVEASDKVQTQNEKQNGEDTNDFFSMVMVPLENEISSPTSEMEHLRVSSPTRKDDILESYDSFKPNSDGVRLNLVNANMNANFNNEHNTNSLETINEESLKQLLYGINEK